MYSHLLTQGKVKTGIIKAAKNGWNSAVFIDEKNITLIYSLF